MHNNIKCCVGKEVREIHTISDSCKDPEIYNGVIRVNFFNKCLQGGDDVNEVNFIQSEYDDGENKDEQDEEGN